MQKILRSVFVWILILGILASLIVPALAVEDSRQATILFTHDLHSHLLPSKALEGGEFGGYARLTTRIRQQKELYPDAILVDAGDFSMGSLFQTAYPSSAIELRMMGAMGFDATTFGNHEFDYLPKGFASMLNVASGYDTPAIVVSNYLPPREGEEGFDEDAKMVWQALENYGVMEYQILERGGVFFAIFGLVGYDTNACAPNSGMILEDPAVAAQRTVDLAVADCKAVYGVEPIVVCLSHGGTDAGEGEDYELAEAVTGIDLIVSGHTHTTLPEAIEVNDTWIVSGGEYGKYLGVVQMEQSADGAVSLTDYELIPVDETVEDAQDIAAMVEAFKTDVERDYLSKYGMTFDQVLTNNTYTFDTNKDVYDYPHESTLGNVFSDAYRIAAEKALGHRVDMALTASGVIRDTIPIGDVTVSAIFNAASLGVGTEGELVEVWVTGADLKNIFEIDASVYPLMHSAQLFMSGVEYSYNTNRMIFNKVDHAMLRRSDGTVEEIQDDKLYCITAGMYMAQMLGSVEKTSMGLLTLTPRERNGEPMDLTRLQDYVIHDENGNPVKEWHAIACHLQSMGENMDPQYAQPDGRKVVYSSLNPVKLLRDANKFTYIALAVVLALIVLVVCIVRIVRKRKLKKQKG